MSGSYTDGRVTLQTDEQLSLRLSPEAFAQWQRPVAAAAEMGDSVGLALPEPTTLTADVDLSVAWRDGPGLRFDPEQTRLDARLRLPETMLVDQWYGRSFPVREGEILIDAPDLREPVQVSVEFTTDGVAGDTGPSRPGRLTAEARLTGAMLDDGYVQLERGRVTAEVDLDRLPTVIFDTLARQRGYAVAAFGEKLSATVNVEDWSMAEGGAVAFEMQSENGSVASFSGRDTGHFFVPDRPMTFFLQQTPALAGRIMRWVNPVLLPAVRSARVPFTLTIDDDSFRLPTRGFSFADIDADVQVQMGTVTIDPTISPVNQIVQPLQRFGVLDRQVSYEARVSPIELRIRDGVFSYDTLTFDIDDVDLSFGGTISLVDQSIDMRLTLGGREIERDPLIRRLVADGIAIGGTVGSPEVNLDSLLAAFRREALPQTLTNVLGDLLQRELRKQREEPDEERP
jgi:hypothetical protein